MPASAGSTATASSPAARATALLTAEATPACSSGAAAEHGRGQRRDHQRQPEAEHQRPGQHVGRVGGAGADPDAEQRARRRATSGPTVIGSRGPIRCASAPERGDSSSMMTVTGSSAVPGRQRAE